MSTWPKLTRVLLVLSLAASAPAMAQWGMTPPTQPGMVPMMMPQQAMPPGYGMMPQQAMPPGYGMMPQQAMSPGYGMQSMPNQLMAQVFHALQLTEEQLTQIGAIAARARAESTQRMSDIADAFSEVSKVLAVAIPDPAAVGEVYGRIFDLQRQSIESSIQVYHDQVEVLDQKQRDLWNLVREKMLEVAGMSKPAQ
jgi:Spy/CpxP family protein refolding chaperone